MTKKLSPKMETYSHAEIERAAAGIEVKADILDKAKVTLSTDDVLSAWEKDTPVSPEADKQIRSTLAEVGKIAADAAQSVYLIGEKLLNLKLSIGGQLFDSLMRSGALASVGISNGARYIEQYKVLQSTVMNLAARRCLLTFGQRALVTRRFEYKIDGVTHYAAEKPTDSRATDIKGSGYQLSPYFAAALVKLPVPKETDISKCESWAKQVTQLSVLLRAQAQRPDGQSEQKTVLDSLRTYCKQHDAIGIVTIFRRCFIEVAKASGADIAQMALSAISADFDSRAWESDAALLSDEPMLAVRQYVNEHKAKAQAKDVQESIKETIAQQAQAKNPEYSHAAAAKAKKPAKADATHNRVLAV